MLAREHPDFPPVSLLNSRESPKELMWEHSRRSSAGFTVSGWVGGWRGGGGGLKFLTLNRRRDEKKNNKKIQRTKEEKSRARHIEETKKDVTEFVVISSDAGEDLM